MNSQQTPPPPIPPFESVPPIKARRRYIPDLIGWLVGIFVLSFLLQGMFPVGSRVQVKGMQTKSLAQAKQIGLALRVFADDHDGNYPRAGLPAMLGAEVKDSNAAFAVLFPTYLGSETLFANRLSAYQTRRPDDVFDDPYTGKPLKTLEPGENVYSYVAGLTVHSDEHAPLVVDGTDGTGHYGSDPKKRGGVWAGKKAIVVRLDNSAAVETLDGPDNARYVRANRESKSKEANLLDVAGLGPDVRLFDPAVSH